MGSINLDHAGSGGAITLSSDGTDLLLGGSAIGGGAPLYSANDGAGGTDPSATGSNSVAIGEAAVSTGEEAVALGKGRAAGSRSFSVLIGDNTSSYGASGDSSASIGRLSKATAAYSFSAGYYAASSGYGSISMGSYSIAMNESAIALGTARASGVKSFAVGIDNNSASYGASGTNSVAIGDLAKATAEGSVALGNSATSSGQFSFATGYQSTASATQSTAIGRANTASGTFALALGYNSTASGADSVVIGDSSTASHTNSISIGGGVQSIQANQVNIGGSGESVRICEYYTLPTSAGNSGQVLTSNGSGGTSFAAPPSPTGYAFGTLTQTAPSATGNNAIAIGDRTTATQLYSVAIGSEAKSVASSGIAIGNSYCGGSYGVAIGGGSNSGSFGALTSSSIAIGLGSKAFGGTGAGAFGYQSIANGIQATAMTDSYAGGADSFAAAIGTNSTSVGALGSNSVAIGYQAKASTGNSVAIGSRAVSTNASIAIGTSYANYGVAASGMNSIVLGDGSAASQTSSVAIGYGANSNIKGKFVYASKSFGGGNAEGSAQGGMFILMSDTTDATAEAMTTDKATADATNQIVAASDTCITFSGTIVAMQNGAQSYGSWEIKGLLVNDGGTTTVPTSAITVISNTSSWGLALSADNTNNALKVQVTGEAAHNIRWVANIQTSEVTYA